MPNEIQLWEVDSPEETHLLQVQSVPLDLEKRLQSWLINDISILDPGLMVIGREVPTDSGEYIDILCIDPAGHLVVVELKRDKTPRVTTAQVLDYCSWAAYLSHEEVLEIAERSDPQFRKSFEDKFEQEFPEALNEDHRILIVGSGIDGGSERIIRYLSDWHNVNINAITFHYFRLPDGKRLVARTFLVEPSTAKPNRKKSRSPNLTDEELKQQAEDCGVLDLYQYALRKLDGKLQKYRTSSCIRFQTMIDDKQRVVLRILPMQSSKSQGLRYQIFKNRFAAHVGRTVEEIEELMPKTRNDWKMFPRKGDPDYDGFEGYIAEKEEIDKMVSVVP